MKNRKALYSMFAVTLALSLVTACGSTAGESTTASTAEASSEAAVLEAPEESKAETADGTKKSQNQITGIVIEEEEEDTSEVVPPTSVVGKWACSEVVWDDNGSTMDTETITGLYGVPAEDLLRVEVYGDHTGTMEMFGGEAAALTWADSEEGYTFTMEQYGEEQLFTASLQDGKLKMVTDVSYESEGETIPSVMTYTLSYVSTVSKLIDGFSLTVTQKMESDMCHFTNGGNRFLVIGDKIFGSFGGEKWGEGDFQVGTVMIDGADSDIVDRTVIIEDSFVNYLTKDKNSLYGIADGSRIFKLDLESFEMTDLYEGSCSYLQRLGDSLYFTDENNALCKMNLDGSGQETVLDHTDFYFPYFLTEDWLFFQDDPDNETIHIRQMSTGNDIRLTEGPSYNPFICGNDLFYLEGTTNEDGDKIAILCKVDLSTGTIERDEKCIYKYIWTNALEGDRIIIGDGLYNVARQDWNKSRELTIAGSIESPLYTNGTIRIGVEYNGKLYLMHEEFIGWMENQTYIGYP